VLAATDGTPLAHLVLRAVRAVGDDATLLVVADDERPLALLVGGPWPEGGAVTGAADLPSGASARSDCTAAGLPADTAVLAAVTGDDGTDVLAAWRAAPGTGLTPLAPTRVTCTPP
jgi:hypothetical protein